MLRIDLRVLLMGLAVLIIILWAVASYQPRPTVVVTPIKINQTTPTQPAPQPPGAVVAGLFLCPGDAYKWRNVIVCNPAQFFDSYVLIQRGWIYAPGNATLRLQGDISTCTLRLGVNTLYIDCAQPVILVKT
jgi:hypothetical protein